MKFAVTKIQRGFTLVELLIVVIILALLAAIVVPQFASSTEDAKEAALDTTLSNVRGAIDLYFQQHGHFPSSVIASGGACAGTAGTGSANSEAAFLDQLAYYTNSAGLACTTKDNGAGNTNAYPLGPYLKKRELGANPITTVSTLLIATAGDLNLNGTAVDLGWRIDNVSGKFIANDTSNDPSGTPYDDR